MQIVSLEWNGFLKGFVATLNDGRTVNVQFDKNTDRLDACFGMHKAVIDKQNDEDFSLTDDEESEFLALLNDEYKAEIRRVESALNEQKLMYDAELRIATFNGALCRELEWRVFANEEAHDVGSIDEARNIWGIEDADNISEECSLVADVSLTDNGTRKFSEWFANVSRKGVAADVVEGEVCRAMFDRVTAGESLVYELGAQFTNTGRPELLYLEKEDLDVSKALDD